MTRPPVGGVLPAASASDSCAFSFSTISLWTSATRFHPLLKAVSATAQSAAFRMSVPVPWVGLFAARVTLGSERGCHLPEKVSTPPSLWSAAKRLGLLHGHRDAVAVWGVVLEPGGSHAVAIRSSTWEWSVITSTRLSAAVKHSRTSRSRGICCVFGLLLAVRPKAAAIGQYSAVKAPRRRVDEPSMGRRNILRHVLSSFAGGAAGPPGGRAPSGGARPCSKAPGRAFRARPSPGRGSTGSVPDSASPKRVVCRAGAGRSAWSSRSTATSSASVASVISAHRSRSKPDRVRRIGVAIRFGSPFPADPLV